MRTGLVERIECRDDLLSLLGVGIDVSKGFDQRDVFGDPDSPPSHLTSGPAAAFYRLSPEWPHRRQRRIGVGK
jgi:hypothetical protein